MGLKNSLKLLGEGLNSKTLAKLTAEFPENVSAISNVIKTEDLRIDLHKHITRPDWVTAKVQANTNAKDKGVQNFIRKVNKGPHAGTHKNIAEIAFDRTKFDKEVFKNQLEQVYKTSHEEEDNGEAASKNKKKGKGGNRKM